MAGSWSCHLDMGLGKKLRQRKYGPHARMPLSSYANEALFEKRLLIEPGSQLRHEADAEVSVPGLQDAWRVRRDVQDVNTHQWRNSLQVSH